MKYRFLGRTGVRVSALGFGTMSFSSEADPGVSARLFDRCLGAGINVFDCADVYAGGRAEAILGDLVTSARDQVVLMTKAYFPMGDGPNDRGLSRYHLVRAVESSLRRLKTDRIDVLFLHRWDDVTDLEDTLRTLDDLVRQGKVLYLAASNFAAWQTMKAIGLAGARGFTPLMCIQPMYNLLKRQAEVELLPMAASEGLGVIPYSPLGGGLLSGKYGITRRPETGRIVDNKMYTVRYAQPANFGVAERFCALAAEMGHHPATLAVAWVRSHPAVTCPLIGARNLEQLEPLLKAADLELTEEERAAVSALSYAPPPATDRNEETSDHNFGSR